MQQVEHCFSTLELEHCSRVEEGCSTLKQLHACLLYTKCSWDKQCNFSSDFVYLCLDELISLPSPHSKTGELLGSKLDFKVCVCTHIGQITELPINLHRLHGLFLLQQATGKTCFLLSLVSSICV